VIRKLISRVFGGKKAAASHREPAVIPVSRHGITRDRISPGSRRVCEGLQQQGHQAYVVGGAVRDLLIGADPKDFDVATDATPDEIRRAFRRSRAIGRRFQIVHVMMGQETIEVTTFRGMLDANAKTDEHGRILHDNVFGSQADDAARRDFTVNALYYDPATEAVIDYHHGVGDLKQKTLRMIGEPRARYREDPVRMLRAVRLAAKLGLIIDPAASRPIREMAELLENVPPARLFDEMLKLLTSGHSVNCITRLRDEGLHHGLLPLLDVILEQPLGEKFVMLALANTDERVRAGKGVSPGFLFATLLWHEVLAHWEKLKAKGESKIPGALSGDGHGARRAGREARHYAPHCWRHQGHLVAAAALRVTRRQAPLRSARTAALPCRLRLPAAARRIRRNRRGTRRLVDPLPEADGEGTRAHADAGTGRRASKRRRRRKKSGRLPTTPQ
jgi:poly(A) polymerase